MGVACNQFDNGPNESSVVIVNPAGLEHWIPPVAGLHAFRVIYAEVLFIGRKPDRCSDYAPSDILTDPRLRLSYYESDLKQDMFNEIDLSP